MTSEGLSYLSSDHHQQPNTGCITGHGDVAHVTVSNERPPHHQPSLFVFCVMPQCNVCCSLQLEVSLTSPAPVLFLCVLLFISGLVMMLEGTVRCTSWIIANDPNPFCSCSCCFILCSRDYVEKVLYLAAEMENVRAIAKRDVLGARRYAVQKFAKQVLHTRIISS